MRGIVTRSKVPVRGEAARVRRVAPAPEVVDPLWLIKAFAAMVLLALVCGYLTLCGLFYRGQWQLVLHPATTSAAPATVGGVAFETVRFGAGPTGVPQLTGWWIPAAPAAAFASLTVLYLRGGDGSLADDQATLARLHDVGINVFAVDYRGYGQSAAMHPSERSMTADTEAAWGYLTSSRAIPGDRVIPYGRGLGCALALGVAIEKRVAPAVVLEEPDFDVEERVRRDPRSRLVPVGLLLRERFALEPGLEQTRVPKLILEHGERESPAVRRAAEPKLTVMLPDGDSSGFRSTMKRFLDQYAQAAARAPGLVPRVAPAS